MKYWRLVKIPSSYSYFLYKIAVKCHLSNSQYPTTVTTFNSRTKCVGSPSIIHDRTSDCNPVFWSWMYEWPQNWTQLWFESYVCHWCAWLVLYILSMGIWTTRHWQTSSRLVHELNVCTVAHRDPPWPSSYDTWLPTVSLKVRVSAGSPKWRVGLVAI